MRVFAALIVVVQLIVQAASVSHSHAQIDELAPADHQNRPHLHIGSHSHSHHVRSQSCGHDLGRCPERDQSLVNDRPVTFAQIESLPVSSGHDDDALYVSVDTPILSSERGHLTDRSHVVDWFVVAIPVGELAVQGRLHEFIAKGSADRVPAQIVFLSHVLRV